MLLKLWAIGAFLPVSAALAAKPAALSPSISEADLAGAGLSLFWEARLPVAMGESLKDGFLRDEALYVTTDRGTFFAIDSDTGLIRWGTKLTEPAYRIYPPSHVQQPGGRGAVVIPTTTAIHVHDRYDGRQITRFAPAFPISSACVAIDDSIFIGSRNGRFYSLIVGSQPLADPVMRWEVLVGGAVSASPVLFGDRNRDLLMASESGAVVSCYAPNKALKWQFQAGGAVLGDPVVDASGVYVPCMDRSLYKLNSDSGAFIWRVLFSSPLSTGPTAVAQTVYQSCSGCGVTALDAITGDQKWRIEGASSFVSHGASGDLLFSPPGRLLLIEHEKGEQLAEVKTPGIAFAVSNPANSAAYLLGGEGRVYCIRLDNVPYLRRQQVEMARRQLNQPPVSEASGDRPLTPTPHTADRSASDPFRSRRDTQP